MIADMNMNCLVQNVNALNAEINSELIIKVMLEKGVTFLSFMINV